MLKLKKKKTVLSVFVAVFLVVVTVMAWPSNEPITPKTVVKSSAKSSTPADIPTSSFNKSQYPLDQASSLWVVVNKGRVLPSSYTPQKLVTPDVPLRLYTGAAEMLIRTDAATALETMVEVAKGDGIKLKLASGYRSYSLQTQVYGHYAATSGAAAADRFSARPGHSEHQTGLAADMEPSNGVCELDVCFKNTPEGRWLSQNSYRFGFIIRYPEGKESITGYQYEPWHIRFVGEELAQQIKKSGQTLEQFFGLPTYATYPAEQYEITNL